MLKVYAGGTLMVLGLIALIGLQYHCTVDAWRFRRYLARVAANSATGLDTRKVTGAQRRESGFFVLALWRAVRGRASALPGS